MPRFEDLTGKKFGSLTAIEYLGNNMWRWQCDCGSITEKLAATVKNGSVKSCGRSCKYSPSRIARDDLSGKRFGRLTVVKQSDEWYTNPSTGRRQAKWHCVCDCGNEVSVVGSKLKSGHTMSCGCLHKEQEEAWKTVNLSHGRATNKNASKSYRTWGYIKRRCMNENDIGYRFYGAKGIRMSDEWIDDPKSFCEYVEALPRYDESGTTIDRIDYSKGYERGNLRWITIQEQQRNKSNNSRVVIDGESLIVRQIAESTGIDARTIEARLLAGWDGDEAVSIPTGSRRHKKDADGRLCRILKVGGSNNA